MDLQALRRKAAANAGVSGGVVGKWTFKLSDARLLLMLVFLVV